MNLKDKESLIDDLIAENCYNTIGDYVELVRELIQIQKTSNDKFREKVVEIDTSSDIRMEYRQAILLRKQDNQEVRAGG